MKAKFITVKGSERLGREPFYVGVLQHERTMSRREAYEYIAGQTGYTPTAVRAVFMAVAEYIRENQARGNITYIDGVASIRNYVRGAFEGLAGPWVKGRNVIMVNAVEMEPFKTVLAAVVPDEITGTDVFSIAGANLAPDATKDDEYVALVDAHGVETKATTTFSDLQNVKAHLEAALPAGEYTLKVYTRSGLGDQFGVTVAARKVAIA